MITREKKDKRLKLWSVEGKRSDNKSIEGTRLKLWSVQRKRNNNKSIEGPKIKVVECREEEE